MEKTCAYCFQSFHWRGHYKHELKCSKNTLGKSGRLAKSGRSGRLEKLEKAKTCKTCFQSFHWRGHHKHELKCSKITEGSKGLNIQRSKEAKNTYQIFAHLKNEHLDLINRQNEAKDENTTPDLVLMESSESSSTQCEATKEQSKVVKNTEQIQMNSGTELSNSFNTLSGFDSAFSKVSGGPGGFIQDTDGRSGRHQHRCKYCNGMFSCPFDKKHNQEDENIIPDPGMQESGKQDESINEQPDEIAKVMTQPRIRLERLSTQTIEMWKQSNDKKIKQEMEYRHEEDILPNLIEMDEDTSRPIKITKVETLFLPMESSEASTQCESCKYCKIPFVNSKVKKHEEHCKKLHTSINSGKCVFCHKSPSSLFDHLQKEHFEEVEAIEETEASLQESRKIDEGFNEGKNEKEEVESLSQPMKNPVEILMNSSSSSSGFFSGVSGGSGGVTQDTDGEVLTVYPCPLCDKKDKKYFLSKQFALNHVSIKHNISSEIFSQLGFEFKSIQL